MRFGLAMLLVMLASGCRVAVAPQSVHRLNDGANTTGAQLEVGGYLGPRTRLPGAGVFLTGSRTLPMGESHRVNEAGLLDLRYRRHFAVSQRIAPYWAAGAGAGDSSDGLLAASHGELGIEILLGDFAFDVFLRHRLVWLHERWYPGPQETFLNVLQAGIGVGLNTLR